MFGAAETSERPRPRSQLHLSSDHTQPHKHIWMSINAIDDDGATVIIIRQCTIINRVRRWGGGGGGVIDG